MLYLSSVLLILYIVHVYSLDNGLGLTPQMGWNSWNKFGCNINETLIKSIADAMVNTHLRDAGYKYVNLDDCWQYSRYSNGTIMADPYTFPSGIPSLAQYVHNKGLLFGLYSDAGNFTCQHRPGSLGYETIDANTYAQWKVDYLKYDNCYNDNIAPQTRYPVMRDALNATGRPIFYSLCEWGEDDPASWAPAVGNSWRTTGDISDNWESVLSNWDNNGPASAAGPGAWNDPDMLEIGNGGLTVTEEKSHFSLWALGKAPLIIGCDVRNMSQSTKNILLNKEVIAVNQDKLGKQCEIAKNYGEQQIYNAPLVDSCYAVGILNRANSTASVKVTWDDLGLNNDAIYVVRDLWLHENLTEATSYWTAIVEPHETVLIKLIPVN